MHNGGVVPYRERVPWPGWSLLLAGFALAGGYVASRGYEIALAALPLFLAAYVFWRVRFLAIESGPDGIAFGFGGIRRHVPRGNIVAVEAMDYPAARYMGWGYRLGWEPRERAYSVLGCRRGILVRFTDDRGRPCKVFLSSKAPEAVLAALKA